MTSDPAVEAEGLVKTFGNIEALRGVSFKVGRGEIFGLLGPNGSGKTTLVRLLSTLIVPTAGTARIFGDDVVRFPLGVKRSIGLVQQALSCEPYLSVRRNISLYAYLDGMSWKDAETASKRVIALFGLDEFADRKAVHLSLGLKRRLQIAREFVREPRLLFLDEPTVGLDPESKRVTLDLIKAKAKLGMTVFFTTHNLSEAEYLCDRVAIVSRGKIVIVDEPQAILKSAATNNLEDAYLRLVKGSRV